IAATIGYRYLRPATAPDAAATDHMPTPARTTAPASRSLVARLAPFLLAAVLPGCLAALTLPPILLQLSSVFAGMSLLAFGGGYVFIPLLQHTVVDAYHWLTPHEFLDALAITQLSPG